MLARTDSRARALFLLVIATLLATLVGGRLVWWQVVDRERLAAMALNQLAQDEEIPAERGEIRDSNGVLLATSVEVQSVFATPADGRGRSGERAVAARLGAGDGGRRGARPPDQRRPVGLAAAPRRRAGGRARGGPRPARRRDAAGDAAGLPGHGVAPGTTLGAQVLGFVNVDGEGQYGIEGGRGRAAGRPARIGERPGGRHRSTDRRLGLRAAAAGRRRRPDADPRRRAAAHPRGRRCGRPSRRTRRRA